VRLERAAVESESFARAYRSGALSGVQASVLVPLVSADSLGWFVEGWVAWAERVTVRRLTEDVEVAPALSETDPEVFRRDGGLPYEARENRGIDTPRRGRKRDLSESCSVRFIGPATAGEALGAMLDHVLLSWGALDEKVAARHKVFARDGWRCAVPGCTSMQNLTARGTFGFRRRFRVEPTDSWYPARRVPRRFARTSWLRTSAIAVGGEVALTPSAQNGAYRPVIRSSISEQTTV
jgi:hypothetical protein